MTDIVMNPMRRITRLDYKSTGKGYIVRFFKNKKLSHHKLFYDKNYKGGQKEALYWAQVWRDDTELMLDRYIYPALYFKGYKSGKKIGTHFSKYTYKRKGRAPKEIWECVATWVEDGQPKTKGFDVYTHGMREAQRLATEHREVMEAQLEKVDKKIRASAKRQLEEA